MINRYYAQHKELQNRFWQSSHQTGWQVFDREHMSDEGDDLAICFCINKTYAYRIRDKLNAQA